MIYGVVIAFDSLKVTTRRVVKDSNTFTSNFYRRRRGARPFGSHDGQPALR